jgi:ParB family chromosome partitioning protein
MSAAPKSRLGRGLGGLIAAAKPAAPAPAAVAPAPHPAAKGAPAAPAPVPAPAPAGAPGYLEVAVHLIEPSPYQARREIAAEHLSELAESIRSEGLLQPIVVRKTGEKFQLIAGERRWRAFQLLKIKTIPARLVEASNASSAALGLIENLQREGLNPIEEAHGYASLIRDFDLTQETAAERVGKGRATVANSLRLLSLEPDLQGYVAKNMLSVGHAKVLLGIDDAAQRAMLGRRIIEEGLSVRATEKLAGTAKVAPATAGGVRASVKPGLTPKDAATVAGIEKKLTSHLGARVALLHAAKKGRIVIEYRGNDDLQRLLEKLGVEA